MGKILLILGITAIVAAILYLVFYIWSRMQSVKILRNYRNHRNFGFGYLSLRFSRRRTLKNVRLFSYDYVNQGKKLVNVELLFVNKGGVFVIKQVPGDGYVEIRNDGPWRRTLNDRTFTFPDPQKANENAYEAIRQLLREEHVNNVPVYNIVLFTGRKVKFSKQVNGVINADDLTPFFIEYNKDRFLVGSEMRKIVRTINKKRVRSGR